MADVLDENHVEPAPWRAVDRLELSWLEAPLFVITFLASMSSRSSMRRVMTYVV